MSKQSNKAKLIEQTKAAYRKTFNAYKATGRWLSQYDLKVMNLRKTLKSCGADPASIEAELLTEAGFPVDALSDVENYAERAKQEAAEEAAKKAYWAQLRAAEQAKREERCEAWTKIQDRCDSVPELFWLNNLIEHLDTEGIDDDTVSELLMLTYDYTKDPVEAEKYRFNPEYDLAVYSIERRIHRYYPDKDISDRIAWERRFKALRENAELVEKLTPEIEDLIGHYKDYFEVPNAIEVFIYFWRSCDYDHADEDEWRWNFYLLNDRIDKVRDIILALDL